MLKQLQILTLLLIPILTIQAQDFWEEIDFPYGVSIFDITVDNQSQIFLACGDGVYKTEDFGVNWEYSDFHRIIRRIESYNDTIYATSDQSEWWSGVWRTEDNGYTWDSIMPFNGITGNVVAILPKGDTIFASIWMSAPRLLMSLDYGQTWELIYSSNNSNELITDIIFKDEDIYISLSGYSSGKGGIFRSQNMGSNWEFLGLLNYQLKSIAFNSSNDLFAASHGGLSDSTYGGLYVLRYGENEWSSLLVGYSLNDMIINNEGHIYCTSGWPSAVIRSTDNGNTFEVINSGLPAGEKQRLTIDNNNYIYVTSYHSLSRSVDPLVDLPDKNQLNSYNLVFPNPADRKLNLRTRCDIEYFQLLDLNGKVVSEINVSGYESVIDVSSLQDGLYFYRILNKTGRTIDKGKWIKK